MSQENIKTKKRLEICTKRKFGTKNQTNDWTLIKWNLSIRKQAKGDKLLANIRG